MRELLIQTAKKTGLVDAEQLAGYLESNKGQERLDEVLLRCPYFTEDSVLKLFAAALDQEFFEEIPTKKVPQEFIEAIPATYAQHHYLIGIRPEDDNGELIIVLSKPLNCTLLSKIRQDGTVFHRWYHNNILSIRLSYLSGSRNRIYTDIIG